jgi:8-oxo-dGTP pyrophosphatase MutT (NUDIX family)
MFTSIEPSATGFVSAFVLPVTRDGRALVTKEKRGSETKYGLLGGSAKPDETECECMAREAKEETGGALSDITITRIRGGKGVRKTLVVLLSDTASSICRSKASHRSHTLGRAARRCSTLTAFTAQARPRMGRSKSR